MTATPLHADDRADGRLRARSACGATRTASLRIAGGNGAPRAARLGLRSTLRSTMSRSQLDDVALIVTEMVTNSVRHAGVGPRGDVGIELLVFGDRVRLAVVDPGSTRVPRLVRRLADESRGIGLLVVDRLSLGWGVARDGAGVTRTWCDVPLHSADVSSRRR